MKRILFSALLIFFVAMGVVAAQAQNPAVDDTAIAKTRLLLEKVSVMSAFMDSLKQELQNSISQMKLINPTEQEVVIKQRQSLFWNYQDGGRTLKTKPFSPFCFFTWATLATGFLCKDLDVKPVVPIMTGTVVVLGLTRVF